MYLLELEGPEAVAAERRQDEDFGFRVASGGYMAYEASWHHEQGLSCPFDCSECEARCDDSQWAEVHPLVSCGHCKGRHTVAGVRECYAR